QPSAISPAMTEARRGCGQRPRRKGDLQESSRTLPERARSAIERIMRSLRLTPPRGVANVRAMDPRDPAAERSRLLAILLERSLRFGKFKLASGAESDFYVDVRKTNLDPEGVRLVARLLADVSGLGTDRAPTAVGGPTLGADPMVTALGLEALARGARVECFLVRKEAKGHGTASRIEGNLSSGARVLLVDDVLTQGGSLLSAAEAVR